jgi:hypothetical protein
LIFDSRKQFLWVCYDTVFCIDHFVLDKMLLEELVDQIVLDCGGQLWCNYFVPFKVIVWLDVKRGKVWFRVFLHPVSLFSLLMFSVV